MTIDPNERVEAVWTVNSETSREFLIDIFTNKILAERINGQIVEVKE